MGRLVVLLVAVASLAASPSRACINAVVLSSDGAARLVAKAEKALEEGRCESVLRWIQMDEHYFIRNDLAPGEISDGPAWWALGGEHIDAKTPEQRVEKPADLPLMRRLELVTAVAQSRCGYVSLAVERLRAIRKGDPRAGKEDVFVSARLAEALSRARKEPQRAEALHILADLEARDLVPDAEAFAALASLRRRAGDAAGAERARAGCLKIAKRPAVCAPAEK